MPDSLIETGTPRDWQVVFLTGTGRCGTMLLARLLSLSPSVVCEHESCFLHRSMQDAVQRGDLSGYQQDIIVRLPPRIESVRRGQSRLGVSSAHLCFALPLLKRRFGTSARYIALVRRPDEFVRSALARGFFDPDHPNTCQQVLPGDDDPMQHRWAAATPFEKCLWYWALVNRAILDSFDAIAPTCRRMIIIDEFDHAGASQLIDWLDISNVPHGAVAQLLEQRINASPGPSPNDQVNPWSQPITLPPARQWSADMRRMLDQYTAKLWDRITLAVDRQRHPAVGEAA